MSESSWVLTGVDPNARQSAVEEAARRGLSLADYLTDIVLQNALAEQVREHGPAFPELEPVAPAATDDAFGLRNQIKALERRLGSSVTSLDGALNALDVSLFDLTGRVGDLEALAGDTARTSSEQLKDMHGSLAVLRLELSNIQDAAKVVGESNDVAHATLADACGELERRLADVEAIARGADLAASQLANAQHAYRLSVSNEVEALSRETAARVGAGLEQVRAAADEAAAQADAAAAHLIAELRALRRSVDERLLASAAESKNRVQAAFAEASERLAALGDRVTAGERQTERHAEHVRTQIANVEDGVQTALEESTLALRRADAVLAADIVRAGENNRLALEALRADLAIESADLNERQLDTAARLAAVEAAQESFDRRVSAASAATRNALDQVDVMISEQFDAAASRTSELEQDIAHVRRTLGAEIARVEACTVAALEQHTHDRNDGDARLNNAIDDMRRRVEEQVAALRGQQAQAQARLDAVDAALAPDGGLAHVITATADEVASLRSRTLKIEAADREIVNRIAHLQQSDADTERELGLLRDHVAAVANQVPAGQTERLQALELSVASLHDEQHTISATAEAIATVESRVAAFEKRQSETLHALREDVAAFVDQNHHRLCLLEAANAGVAAPFAAIEQRLAELEHHDVAIDFAELRARIEDRIAGLEQRNVRMLESLSETVALIENRLLGSDAGAVARTA